MVAASKKKRVRSKTQTPKAFKRSRVSTAPAPKTPEHKGPADVPFPAPILSLPHVMELIDSFRMTPAEAAWQAATTGQSKWLGQIISSNGINVTSPDMLIDAAGKGYDEVVKLVLPALVDFRHENRQARWKTVLPAVKAASAGGCYTTLTILLPELKMGELRGVDANVACTAVDTVLCEAAERGCLDAVKLMVKHAKKNYYTKKVGKSSKALSRAAAAGHTDVIEVLMKLDIYSWKWDLPHAVAAAVETKQTAIAKTLYGENPEYDGKSFFVCLARDGYVGAVEYFFPKVRGDVTLLKEALLEAAKEDQSDVVAFLVGTKRIRSETVKRAFVTAAGYEACSVVKYLLDNYQVPSETIGEGFISATEGNHYGLMQSLYVEQQISADVVLEAFKTTSGSMNLQTLKCLIGFLSDETRIPQEFKHKAFVDAALTYKMTALQQLTMRGHEELPLKVLKEAHTTKCDRTKKIVCRVTCEQLFNSNDADRFDAVAKLVEEWKSESTGKRSRLKRKSK
jgi:hypothetical protein